MERLLFVNLPVENLDKSVEFFTKLGFEFDPNFTDDRATMMKISSQANVMLLTKERFAEFLPAGQAVANTADATGVLVSISAESREAVQEVTQKAMEAGATPAMPPQEYPFMYGTSFNDLDGHHWEVMWMDLEAMQAGS